MNTYVKNWIFQMQLQSQVFFIYVCIHVHAEVYVSITDICLHKMGKHWMERKRF